MNGVLQSRGAAGHKRLRQLLMATLLLHAMTGVDKRNLNLPSLALI